MLTVFSWHRLHQADLRFLFCTSAAPATKFASAEFGKPRQDRVLLCFSRPKPSFAHAHCGSDSALAPLHRPSPTQTTTSASLPKPDLRSRLPLVQPAHTTPLADLNAANSTLLLMKISPSELVNLILTSELTPASSRSLSSAKSSSQRKKNNPHGPKPSLGRDQHASLCLSRMSPPASVLLVVQNPYQARQRVLRAHQLSFSICVTPDHVTVFQHRKILAIKIILRFLIPQFKPNRASEFGRAPSGTAKPSPVILAIKPP
ncbi:hypothetical protein KFK09_001147 [Dendrobium nobile]|uniref:Uncharacterized protein n=1 Tax=Dendrobium nobile TaxID=94219 RepID=A0A8T3CA14_DENNO|nr:hypothetical protein KFK09_001147 [Dendrobium nobile]